MPFGWDDKLTGPGWESTDSDMFVADEDSYDYAIERITYGTDEEKQEFVEWFYSGNWIKVG